MIPNIARSIIAQRSLSATSAALLPRAASNKNAKQRTVRIPTPPSPTQLKSPASSNINGRKNKRTIADAGVDIHRADSSAASASANALGMCWECTGGVLAITYYIAEQE